MRQLRMLLAIIVGSLLLLGLDARDEKRQAEHQKQLFLRDFYAGTNRVVNRRHIPVFAGYHAGTIFCVVDEERRPIVNQLAMSLQALFYALELETTVEQQSALEDCSEDATKYIQIARSYDPERSKVIAAAENFFGEVRNYDITENAVGYTIGSGGSISNYVDTANEHGLFSIAFVDWVSLEEFYPEHAEDLFRNTFLEESLQALTTVQDIRWFGRTNSLAQESSDFIDRESIDLGDWLRSGVNIDHNLVYNAQGLCFTDLLFLIVVEDLEPAPMRMSDVLMMIDERYDSYAARAERAYDDEEARFVLDLDCR